MTFLSDIEKFIASDAGQIIKGTGKGMWKFGNGHVKFYNKEGGIVKHHELTAAENKHLQDGGRLILVYDCGHRVALQF